MRKSSIILLSVLLSLTINLASAHASRDSLKVHPEEAVGAMSEKIVRGVANVATGWLELPKQVVMTFKKDGAVKGIFVGPLKGIGMTVVRTVAGAGELATFFLPYPGFYDPYFTPEYVWQTE